MASKAVAIQDLRLVLADDEIILDVPGRAEVNALLGLFTRQLASSAVALGKKRATIREKDGTITRIPSILSTRKMSTVQPLVATPDIAIAEMMISAPFLRVLNQMIETPGARSGIVRVEDNRQLVVSQSMAPMISGDSVKAATRRRREDYWHLPDLAAFEREWRQRLTVDDPDSVIEFRFACYDPVSKGNWRQMVNTYRAVELGGVLYHYSTNVGCESITMPS